MKKKMKLTVEKSLSKSDNVRQSISLFENLVKDCATPTDEEMKKLIGIQSVSLMALGMSLMQAAMEKPKIDRGLIKLAMEAMDKSRMAAAAAAKIEVDPEMEEELEKLTSKDD